MEFHFRELISRGTSTEVEIVSGARAFQDAILFSMGVHREVMTDRRRVNRMVGQYQCTRELEQELNRARTQIDRLWLAINELESRQALEGRGRRTDQRATRGRRRGPFRGRGTSEEPYILIDDEIPVPGPSRGGGEEVAPLPEYVDAPLYEE